MKKYNNIERIRNRIDDLDLQMLKLLSARGKLVQRIGGIKKKQGKQIRDPLREHAIIRGLSLNNLGPYSLEDVQLVFRDIIRSSYALESRSGCDYDSGPTVEKKRSFRYNQVVLVGVGLMGASLARDLLKRGIAKKVIGLDSCPATLRYAKKNKIISDIATDVPRTLATSDLVILATPVRAIVNQIQSLAAVIPPTTLVMDVGSTKTSIVKTADRCFIAGNFVACHPMTGRALSGPHSSVEGLFEGKVCLIVPGNKNQKKFLEQAKGLWEKLGARVETVSVAQHDRWLALCSHLPQVLSFVLLRTAVKKIGLKALVKVAGPGFKEQVRLAGSDARMWTDILLQNREHVLVQLTAFIAELGRMEQLIQKTDERKLFECLRNTACLQRNLLTAFSR